MTPAMSGILPNAVRGVEAAQLIQLYMAYAPEPPFNSGTPETAPAAILNEAHTSVADVTTRREATARRVAARLGVDAG
jgi:cyclohexyl-isocyanide hydratase